MPIQFSCSTVADALGYYESPPLPEGVFRLHINTRVKDPTKSDEAVVLDHVFLDVTKELDNKEPALPLDFQAEETVKIMGSITLPESGVRARRAPLISIQATVNGSSWLGTSVKAQPNPRVQFVVPKGAENVTINTGRVDIQAAPGEPFKSVVRHPLGKVTSDIKGIVIRLK